MRRIGFIALVAFALLAGCQKKTDEHAGHTPATTEATPPSNPALDPQRTAGPLAEFGNGASGYLSVPTTEGRKPALIVIHEWWGVPQELTKHGKLNDIKIYEGAGHAFMNPGNEQGYDAAAAQDAWNRMDRFFGRTLRANMPNS